MQEEAPEGSICFWISYLDENKPKNEQFQGAVITLASSVDSALLKILRNNIAPLHTEVACMIILAENVHRIKPNHYDCLLSKEEIYATGYLDKETT